MTLFAIVKFDFSDWYKNKIKWQTDAASVLHEAMGYIKFLQDQIQVLCSPYLINHSLVSRSLSLSLLIIFY